MPLNVNCGDSLLVSKEAKCDNTPQSAICGVESDLGKQAAWIPHPLLTASVAGTSYHLALVFVVVVLFYFSFLDLDLINHKMVYNISIL